MSIRRTVRLVSAALIVAVALVPRPAAAQAAHPTERIPARIDDQARVVLHGNRHPLARSEYDRGPAPPETRMERMMLVLEPDAGQQQELEELLAAQQDPGSTAYHQWLTPEEFGQRFGIAQPDLERLKGWLEAHGLEVEPIESGRRVLVFSGTAEQVESTFHTRMRRYEVKGEMHFANATEPQIPRVLAGVVRGIVSLHDFRAEPQHRLLQPADSLDPEFTSGSAHYMAPADFAVIYDAGPLYSAAIDGRGQSIAVAGRSNLKLADIQAFRSRFGLPAANPTILVNGRDPGIFSIDEQSEATLDVEWAGAVARGASIQFVVSASGASDGVYLSSQYIVSHNLAPVMSVSFGACEAALGSAGNAMLNALWQQAAAEGITVLVASGDSGAAGCESPSTQTATSPAGVNGLCSTAYSTCVGGTQFSDTGSPSAYWSSSSNAATLGSALSYIPEAAWNSSGVVPGGSALWASGGGVSSVYSKPSWQSGTGVPAGAWRAVPDVSLNASTHDGYLLWLNGILYAAGGTSASTPSFAGLMAMAVQKKGARLGNVNATLYGLAAKQAAGGTAMFHDVTAGNNSVPGEAGRSAGIGYDAVTGLGSVDANLLVTHWSDSSPASPALQLGAAPTSVSVASGAAVAVTVSVSGSGGFNSPVTFSTTGLPAGLTAAWSKTSLAAPGSGSATLTVSASAQIAPGSYTVVVKAQGGNLSQTASIAVTVPCTYAIDPKSVTAPAIAASYSVNVTTGAGCSWLPSSGASWITITSGTGVYAKSSGKATYAVAANTGTAARTGVLTIAGQTLNFTQSAPGALAPATASAAAAGASGTLSLTGILSVPWTAASNVSWIAITRGSSGTGPGSVNYTVSANTSTSPRTGTLTVGNLRFTVTQTGAAPCSYHVSTGATKATSTGVTGTLAITAASGCAWTASSNASWLAISSGATGSGNGSVTFQAVNNNTKSSRSAAIIVAGYAVNVAENANATGLSSITVAPKP